MWDIEEVKQTKLGILDFRFVEINSMSETPFEWIEVEERKKCNLMYDMIKLDCN